jgi:hypothetical protein
MPAETGVLAASAQGVYLAASGQRADLQSPCVPPWSVSGGDDTGFLDHEYATACRDDRPVEHFGWDGERLPRPELNGDGAVEFDEAGS